MAAGTEQSSHVGDTDETVANEVVNVVNVEDQQQQSKDGEGEGVGDEESKKRKAMVPRSDVWDHFSKTKIANGEERGKCKYCGKLLCCDTKLNGSVHRNLNFGSFVLLDLRYHKKNCLCHRSNLLDLRYHRKNCPCHGSKLFYVFNKWIDIALQPKPI